MAAEDSVTEGGRERERERRQGGAMGERGEAGRGGLMVSGRRHSPLTSGSPEYSLV